VSASFTEFESFRAELHALFDSVSSVQSRTLRDEGLRERFRTLFRVWVSTVEPSIRLHLQSTREFFKLADEVEKLAQQSSKIKPQADYRKRVRTAIQLADSLVIYLPSVTAVSAATVRSDLFISQIPDLPVSLVPNPILGWKSRMEAFLRDHPFDKSVFIMVRYRKRNDELIKSAKDALHEGGLFGVVASEHSLTDDLYNPIACLLCCSRGIAIFDRAEQEQQFNPNVAYELGMLHLLNRRCLILKHKTLKTLQTDILMKLYEPFSGPTNVSKLTASWIQKLAE
jgi:hypothetical protein